MDTHLIPVAVIVPCYNEEDGLPHLAVALDDLRRLLRERYAPAFIFVDDGSCDRTPQVLRQLFGARPDCEFIRLEPNRGIAAALLAGIRHASAEIVCTIDSDCTYDPRELVRMIPLLQGNVQVVTASPYHPQGHVLDVPPWRLRLSKAASALYRLILHQNIATYTSCFRVYRRSAVAGLRISDERFAGVAEILGRLDLAGAEIAEFPTTLRVRSAGQSKMKLYRTIVAQLAVLARLLFVRLFSPRRNGAKVARHPPQNDFRLQASQPDILAIREGQDHAANH
jgi:glycosyltransferase involved in cell wall biosynthesis